MMRTPGGSQFQVCQGCAEKRREWLKAEMDKDEYQLISDWENFGRLREALLALRVTSGGDQVTMERRWARYYDDDTQKPFWLHVSFTPEQVISKVYGLLGRIPIDRVAYTDSLHDLTYGGASGYRYVNPRYRPIKTDTGGEIDLTPNKRLVIYEGPIALRLMRLTRSKAYGITTTYQESWYIVRHHKWIC